MNWFVLPFCFVMSCIVLLFFYDGEINVWTIMEILLAILVLLIVTYVSGRLYDNTWDGNTYHKMGVGFMKYHWNPLRELPEGDVGMRIIGTDQMADIPMWTEAYTKGTETFGAAIYSLTGNIECGKAYTLLGMFCAFGVTYYFLRRCGKSLFFSITFSIVVAINPIAIQQIDSFYVDGFLHIMIYILVITLIMYINGRLTIKAENSTLIHTYFNPWMTWSLIASLVVICANIKFTGLLFSAVYCIAHYLFKCYFYYKSKNDWKKRCIIDCAIFGVIAVVAVLWGGATSYLTNLLRHHTLGYPLTGENPISFEETISPFYEKNHISNLFHAVYSELDSFNYASGRVPELKIPLTWHPTEERIALLRGVDVLLSGFGIYFSAAFSIGLIATFVGLIVRKKNMEYMILMLNVIIGILLCAWISESWYAKYSPHTYYFAIIGLYIILDSHKIWISKGIGIFTSFVLIVNALVFLYFIPWEVRHSIELRENIKSLRQYDCIYYDYTSIGSYPAICFNLLDEGVHYEVNLDINEAGIGKKLHEEYPYFSRTYWCPR